MQNQSLVPPSSPTHTLTHTHMHACLHTCTHARMHTHTHTHTHIYTHTYTPPSGFSAPYTSQSISTDLTAGRGRRWRRRSADFTNLDGVFAERWKQLLHPRIPGSNIVHVSEPAFPLTTCKANFPSINYTVAILSPEKRRSHMYAQLLFHTETETKNQFEESGIIF